MSDDKAPSFEQAKPRDTPACRAAAEKIFSAFAELLEAIRAASPDHGVALLDCMETAGLEAAVTVRRVGHRQFVLQAGMVDVDAGQVVHTYLATTGLGAAARTH